MNGKVAGSQNIFVSHKDGLVYIGIVTPFGVFWETFSKIDWYRWLKEEEVESMPLPLPKYLEEAFNE